MAVETKIVRRHYVRNPERVDQIVLAAMEKLRVKQGDQVKASPEKLLEAMPEKKKPSRITVYRALGRLADQGKFRIVKGGGIRPRAVYDFSTGQDIQEPVPNGEVVGKIRAIVDHEKFLMERNSLLEKELAEIKSVLASAA